MAPIRATSRDQPQNLLEQFPRHRDLGHLEDDVASMAHDLGADLHQFLPQAGQRPLLDHHRRYQAETPPIGLFKFVSPALTEPVRSPLMAASATLALKAGV